MQKFCKRTHEYFSLLPPPVCFSPLCPLRGSVGWWSQSWYISDDSCHSCHAIHHFIYYLCLHRSIERKLWGDLWGWDTRSWQSTKKHAKMSICHQSVCLLEWAHRRRNMKRQTKLVVSSFSVRPSELIFPKLSFLLLPHELSFVFKSIYTKETWDLETLHSCKE